MKSIENTIDEIYIKCYPGEIVGLIQYDYDFFCHDTRPCIGTNIPIVLINGSDGENISKFAKNCSIDFYINQSFNSSVISYNVIGQINGTDSNKTVLVCSLYDSMWCQGTVDSAIGVGIVLTMAKYFKELEQNGKRPKYNMRFIAFGGEEYNMIGAKYYEVAHRNENIPLVIDINQVGYSQLNPPQIMHVITNNAKAIKGITEIIGRSNYNNSTTDGSVINIDCCPFGSRSNDLAFASSSYRWNTTQTVLFLKDFGWMLHHRDGRENGTGPLHTAGDTMNLYNDTEVALTADMVLNVTYGLLFKKEIEVWNWPGFIPFFIVIIIIIFVIILILKKKLYFIFS